MLAWRPNPETGRLERADSQPWCKDLPEGSHRYPAEWLKKRYSWVDEEMRPLKPELPHATEEDAEVTYDEPPAGRIHMSCWKGSELEAGVDNAALVLDAAEEDLDMKLARELYEKGQGTMRQEKLDELVTGIRGAPTAGGSAAEKKKQWRRKRRQMRTMMRKSMIRWRRTQQELLSQYSRRQLLQTLVPEAGRSKQAKRKQDEGKSKTSVKVLWDVSESG